MGRQENIPDVEGFQRSEIIQSVGGDVDLITYDQLYRIARHTRMQGP